MEARLLDDRDLWNACVVDCPTGNILQSYEWGEFKALFDWKILRVSFCENRKIYGLAQLLFRHTPAGTIAYCPRGPLLDYHDESLTRRAFEALHEIARGNGASFLKIEPPVPDSPAFAAQMKRLGFRHTEEVQPRSTIIVDLQHDVETLLARLNIKTRYNVGLASRRNVRILDGRDEDISLFYDLLERTSERSNFSIHSREYYEKAWHCLKPKGMAHVLLASCDGEIVAGTMIFVVGQRAYYMYGASNGKNRNLKPSDLLQWESIKWARSVGCTSYDMWGIPDEVGMQVCGSGLSDSCDHHGERVSNGNGSRGKESNGDESNSKGSNGKGHDGNGENGNGGDETSEKADAAKSPLWGVYLFKRGFGGEVVRYAGAFDYVYSPIQFWLWTKALPFKRQLFGKLRKLQPSREG